MNNGNYGNGDDYSDSDNNSNPLGAALRWSAWTLAFGVAAFSATFWPIGIAAMVLLSRGDD